VRVVDGGAIDHYAEGFAVDSGGRLVVTTTDPIDHYHQGLGFSVEGRLCVIMEGTIDHWGSGSAPFDATGRLVMTEQQPEDYIGGVGYNAGRVYVIMM